MLKHFIHLIFCIGFALQLCNCNNHQRPDEPTNQGSTATPSSTTPTPGPTPPPGPTPAPEPTPVPVPKGVTKKNVNIIPQMIGLAR